MAERANLILFLDRTVNRLHESSTELAKPASLEKESGKRVAGAPMDHNITAGTGAVASISESGAMSNS
jgi:hypothetical protein